MPHYANSETAKHGDLVVLHKSYEDTETLLVIRKINATADSCNASAIPVASRQSNAPWFPCASQPDWMITLKECMRFEAPAFPVKDPDGKA